MSNVANFGSAFSRPNDPPGFMAGLIDEITTQVLAKLPKPVVNVAAPQVRVDAPAVTVTPTLTTSGPVPVVNVHSPGMEELAAAISENNDLLERMNASLQAVVVLLQKPVLKVVERGKGGLISEVRETRG